MSVSGSKNSALKALVAACMTKEEVTIENIPLISDFFIMKDIIEELGGTVKITDHRAVVQMKEFAKTEISLETAARIRTSSMFLAPLLSRVGRATIPNPGGCRIGARPIDRTIEGLSRMGALVSYRSEDGYFHARLSSPKRKRLTCGTYRFTKNTHTGTETLILAAALAEGTTILENAAEEPEIDELIKLLNAMGGRIERRGNRTITIHGVERLHGTTITIQPDRNEVVTLAVAAIITRGDIFIPDIKKGPILAFLNALSSAGGGIEETSRGIRFFAKGSLLARDVTTGAYPHFMTDWQGPWAVLMTKARGTSVIHETVYENRFGYASELIKMGADITLFNPVVENPETFYNFNMEDNKHEYFHAIKIRGPVDLHNAVVTMTDLRAGATLLLAALAARGTSVIFGVEHLDRGYERLEERLRSLGADIERTHDE